MIRKLLIASVAVLGLMAPASAAIVYQPGAPVPVPVPTVPQGVTAHWEEFGEWVQIASRATLTNAIYFAASVQKHIPNTFVFSSNVGWYAVVVGPYRFGTGAAAAHQLVHSGIVPGDAFVTSGDRYGALLWGISPVPMS